MKTSDTSVVHSKKIVCRFISVAMIMCDISSGFFETCTEDRSQRREAAVVSDLVYDFFNFPALELLFPKIDEEVK